ncbi:hypothetical protein MHYP_G00301970 [Metynnis hypsauchen]
MELQRLNDLETATLAETRPAATKAEDGDFFHTLVTSTFISEDLILEPPECQFHCKECNRIISSVAVLQVLANEEPPHFHSEKRASGMPGILVPVSQDYQQRRSGAALRN